MTRLVLNRGTIANDGTGDTLRAATIKIEQNFEEIYQKLGNGTFLMPNIDFDSSGILIKGNLSFDTRISAPNSSANRANYFPNASGTLVLDSAEQTLTNKTLTNPIVSQLDLRDSSGNYLYQVRPSGLSNNVLLTIPTVSDSDEFTLNRQTQTLSNKTLVQPIVDDVTITGGLLDNNGNELLTFTGTAGADNHVNITTATSTNDPVVSAAGADTNIDLRLSGKGDGGVRIQSSFIMATETVTASGAASLAVPVTFLNQATAITVTLADADQSGETKYFLATGVPGGSAFHTLTPTNLANATSITFDSSGDSIMLIWSGSEWFIANNNGATIT